MDKFLNEEIEFLDVTPTAVNKIESLAGGSYIEHVEEINSMIDEINKSNAETYRKASFCSIGS